MRGTTAPRGVLLPNSYPQRFLDLFSASGGLALDCGAGGRKMAGAVSLEIEAHPNNSVQASGLDLPFRDGSFDVVLSQAVLEHVTDPQRYVDECVRVLVPGGALYIEAAFMQPVHQAPIHFQNFTPFGLAHVCQALKIEGQGAIGGVAEWWDWIARENGALRVLGSHACQTIRYQMERVDREATPEEVWNTSSGVWLLGRKR